MDESYKRDLIRGIKDEVKIFHPLLQSILPKMPSIESYEYTHGVHERGADFILVKKDLATSRRVHVGVVAKAGKISADIRDVEEQIRECAEERSYKLAERIRCKEVWVFSTGGYSERAREKLEARFSERVIHFFGPEDIVSFVDSHNAYFWHDLPHKLGDYFQNLTKRLEILDHSTTVTTIAGAQDFYIELDTFERTKDTYSRQKARAKSATRTVDLASETLANRISILEAEMGFGKSRLARRIAQGLCKPEVFRKERTIPIYATFREFVDTYGEDVDALLAGQLGESASCRNDPEIRILCILDGLDELHGSASLPATVLENLIPQVKASNSLQLLATTRPFKSLEDKMDMSREGKVYGIRPLSLSKIIRYIEQTCAQSNIPKRLYEDLRKSPLFRQLPQSPIAATLFSNLLHQTPQDVPQTLTELYSKSIDLMLGRWDINKQLANEKQFATAQLVAERLAEYFIENSLVAISVTEAKQFVDSYLARRQTGVSATEVAAILFERSSIFSEDIDAGTIVFRHRSLAEFLCARRKQQDQKWDGESFAFNPAWTNVVFFYAGLRLDCANFLMNIQQREPETEGEKWIKMLAVPSYLLAAYQTEFHIVEENTHLVLIDAARLLQAIRKGDSSTRLNELSEMTLLYLFKILISDSLGYSFFEAAFEPIALRIRDSSEDDETKIVALFLLGATAAELGSPAIFEFLLSDYATTRLPPAISFAISAETKAHTNLQKSPRIKAHRERLLRLLQDSGVNRGKTRGSNQKDIDDLFDKPLKARLETKAPKLLN